MTAISPPRIPRLILDTLYAPQTPTTAVAALVDVALTHHNCGRFDEALVAYTNARRAWENALLRRVAVEASVTAEFDAALDNPRLLEKEYHYAKDTADQQHADGTDPSPVLLAKAEMLQEKINLFERVSHIMAQRDKCIPAEHQIFFHLAIAAVYTSALDDANALSELTVARQLLVSAVPVHHASLIATNVYAALGVSYFHLSQFDYAGDYFFRCLEGREVLCGSNHVDTAAAANNVGATLMLLGRVADALVLFNRALQIVKDQLPESHPRVETASFNVKLARDGMLQDATFAPVPFTPYTPPMIPGAKKALQFRQGIKQTKKKPAPKKVK